MQLRRAFTLIELLVVVVIIAALISILIPAVSLAKSRAEISACLANMHATNLAMQMYGQDNRAFPYTSKDCAKQAPNPYPPFNALDVGCTGLDNGSPNNDENAGMWAQTQLCPHALGPYMEGTMSKSLCCPNRFQTDTYGGIRHYQGRPYLAAMFFATYHDSNDSTTGAQMYMAGSYENYLSTLPTASADGWRQIGPALAWCNTRVTATFSWLAGSPHQNHFWGFCIVGPFGLTHGMNLDNPNGQANAMMWDGSAQTVTGFVAAPE